MQNIVFGLDNIIRRNKERLHTNKCRLMSRQATYILSSTSPIRQSKNPNLSKKYEDDNANDDDDDDGVGRMDERGIRNT